VRVTPLTDRDTATLYGIRWVPSDDDETPDFDGCEIRDVSEMLRALVIDEDDKAFAGAFLRLCTAGWLDAPTLDEFLAQWEHDCAEAFEARLRAAIGDSFALYQSLVLTTYRQHWQRVEDAMEKQ
jgi:hypothetical protein